jgi:hypothetical protein
MSKVNIIETGEIAFNKLLGLEDLLYPFAIRDKEIYFSDIDFLNTFIIKFNKEDTRINFQDKDCSYRVKVLTDNFINRVEDRFRGYKFKNATDFLVDSLNGDLIWDINNKLPVKICSKVPPIKQVSKFLFGYYVEGTKLVPAKISTDSTYNVPALAYVQNFSPMLLKSKPTPNRKTISEFSAKIVFELMCMEVDIPVGKTSISNMADYFKPKREKRIIPDKNTESLERLLANKSDIIYGLRKDITVNDNGVIYIKDKQIPLLPETNKITILEKITKDTLSLSKIVDTGIIDKDGELELDLDLLSGYGITRGYVKDSRLYFITQNHDFYLGNNKVSNLDILKSALNLDNVVVLLKDNISE